MIPPGQLDLLRAAETRGALPLALELICEEEVESSDARSKLVEWLAYPTVLAMFVLPVSGFQALVILPKFKQIRENMGVGPADPLLPYAVELLITAFFVIGFAILLLRRGLPGPLVQAMARARDAVLPSNSFFRRRQGRWLKRVAALLRSGATLPEALEGTVTLRDVGDPSIHKAARLAREGQPLEPVLSAAFGVDAGRMLPPALLSAERHGSIGEGFDALGRREEERAERKLRSLAEMLRPAPVVLLALIAGSQVFDVFLTITTINEALVNPW
jgi:type II secretory pathway component PulF